MEFPPIKPKTKQKQFVFTDFDGDESLRIGIPEVLDASYGMYVWPCAAVLAQYIWYHRAEVKNRNILEIGAGTALPGVLAARLGANVVLSDASHFPQCLENCRQSCLANSLAEVRVVGLSWGQFDSSLLELGCVNTVISADCFYDTKDFEDILVTISYILEKNPNCEFWTTYQERSSGRSIEALLKKWKLHCRSVDLSSFDADDCDVAQSGLPGPHSIEMLIITAQR